MTQILRSLIRSALSLFGFGVYKFDSPELFNFWNLLFLISRGDGHIKYLQIGANDGVLADPMYEFVCKNQHCVSGLLVEPVGIYFQKLERNYSKFRSITAVRRGIHNYEKSMSIYTPKQRRSKRENTAVAGMSSFNKNHLLRDGLLTETDIDEEQVQCSTMKELLQEYDFLDINVLVIDTEGYDFDILENLDLNQIKPKIILFEHGLAAGTMTSNELESLCKKFNTFDYQVTILNNDAIAIQTQFMTNCLNRAESNLEFKI